MSKVLYKNDQSFSVNWNEVALLSPARAGIKSITVVILFLIVPIKNPPTSLDKSDFNDYPSLK